MSRHDAELRERGLSGARARWEPVDNVWRPRDGGPRHYLGFEYWARDREGRARRRRYRSLRGHDGGVGRFSWRRWPGGREYSGGLYYFEIKMTLDAIAGAGGLLWLCNGESSVEAMYAAGVWNALSWFGEGSIPKTLVDDLRHWGVRRVILVADDDQAGYAMAAKLTDLLAAVDGMRFEARSLAGRGGDGYDAADLWRDVGFDADQFRIDLTGLPAVSQETLDGARESGKPKRAPQPWVGPSDDRHPPREVIEAIMSHLGISGMQFNAKGYTRRHFLMPAEIRHESTPSADFNRNDGHLTDWGTGQRYSGWDLAERFGIAKAPWTLARERKAAARRETTTSSEAVGSAEAGADGAGAIRMPIELPSPQDAPLHCYEPPHCIEEARYCADLPVEILNKRTVALRARKGTGKTHWVRQLFGGLGRGKRALAVFAYTQQARQFANMADGECLCYDDFQGADRAFLLAAPMVASTVKSLPKLLGAYGGEIAPEYDLVFVDEANEVIRQLHSGIYRKAEAMRSYRALRELLASAGRRIVAGADISDLEVEFLHEATGAPVQLIENRYRPEHGVAMEWQNRLAMIDAAVWQATKADAPVFIGCGSKTLARQLAMLAEERGLAREQVALITAETTDTAEIAQLVSAPLEECARRRAVIYTYSIGSGFSYDGPCAGLYVVDDNRGMTPMQVAQMMNRARRPESYHYCTFYDMGDADAEPVRETDAAVIEAQFLERHRLDGFRAAPDQIEFLRWHARYQARENGLREMRWDVLRALLRDQGHSGVRVVGKQAPAGFADTLKALAARLLDADREATVKVMPVSREQYEALIEARKLETEHVFGRARDRIELGTGQYMVEDVFNHYRDGRRIGYLRNLNTVLSADVLAYEGDQLEQRDGLPLHRRRHWNQRREFLSEVVLALAGFRRGGDIRQALAELADDARALTIEAIEARLNPVLEHWWDWRTIFRGDVRPGSSENRFKVAKAVLKRLGLIYRGVKTGRARTDANGAPMYSDKARERLAAGKRAAPLREWVYHLCPESLKRALRDARILQVHDASFGRDENPLAQGRLAEARVWAQAARDRLDEGERWAVAKAAGQREFEAALAALASVISNDGLYQLETDMAGADGTVSWLGADDDWDGRSVPF